MINVAILGSTGSIGRNTLKVIRDFPERFKVSALSTNSNIACLARQIKIFRPDFAVVYDKDAAYKLKTGSVLKKTRILTGAEGLQAITAEKKIDKVVLAVSGSAALAPLLSAIENKKDIALANKEALVMAGRIIMRRAHDRQVKIIPIDSEQSAIWQCLDGQDKTKLKTVYLTASGGPLRESSLKELRNVSVSRVLKHPRWKMGRKITVDSATMMNKGFEVIEAMHLFALEPRQIKVVVHPEAVIHSMVEFIDGVVLAQLSVTDMRIPIQYALSYPERLSSDLAGIDFCKLKSLNFASPDLAKFPCLRLAYQVACQGGTMGAVLNASSEICVEKFLGHKLRFITIAALIEKVLSRHCNKTNPGLNDILAADSWARQETERLVKN